MPIPYNLNGVVRSKYRFQSLDHGQNGGCGGLLSEYIAWLTFLKGMHNQINGFINIHHEASHVRVSDSERLPRQNLINKERYNRSPRRYHIPVTSSAKHRARLV